MTNSNDLAYIDENLRIIRERCAEAKEKYRSPDDNIRIMAVTKTVAPEAVNHAVKLGLDLLGENRVQEYLSKAEAYDKSAEVQFIGHLQTNKVKYVINRAVLIHSLDSIKLAEAIEKEAAKNDKIAEVLVEVNYAEEDSKFGITKETAAGFIKEVAKNFPHIKIKGLMTIAPFVEDPEENRPVFRGMKQLLLDIISENIDNVDMNVLSMGMTNDYIVAVEEGATMVRVGTAIFGERNYAI